MRRSVCLGIAVCLVAITGFVFREAEATPLFSARTGSSCGSCHVSPTGAGMRTEFGFDYGRKDVPLFKAERTPKALTFVRSEERSLSFGADLRLLTYFPEPDIAYPEASSMFVMQGDVYAAFDPTDYLTLYYQLGHRGTREFWAMAGKGVLPLGLYVRFGQFMRPYGLRLDDHTSFIRRNLGLDVSKLNDQDVGAEVGFGHKGFFGQVMVFNGTFTADSFDNNNEKGLSGTFGYRHSFGSTAVGFGLSGYDNNNADEHKRHYGLYGSVSFWKLSFLAEGDQVTTKLAGAQEYNTGGAAYAAVVLELVRGFDAVVEWDYFDGNVEALRDHTNRFTFGFEFHPYSFLEIKPEYRYWREPGEKADQISNNEVALVLHGWV